MSDEQIAMWQRKGYAVHLVTQRGQPYGSVRRCCEICGIMVWPERQGDDTPMFVTSDENYAQMGDQRCEVFMKPNARNQRRA